MPSTSERLERLQRLTDAVSRAKDLDETLSCALDCLLESTDADHASILLFDDAGSMRFRAWRGLSDGYRRAVDGHSPWDASAVDPEPLLVPDVAADPALTSYLPVFQAEGIGALGFIPLLQAGQLIGKFMLYYRQPHAFGPDEVQIARIIAGHIAFAVHQRQAQRLLQESEERARAAYAAAREADRYKDQFLATLAHELRNPLAPIRMSVQLLRRAGGRALNTEQLYEIIERQTNHLVRLVDDLLDVSRISRGKLELRKDEVQIADVLSSAVETSRPLIDGASHRLELAEDLGREGGRPLVVDADPVRLAQIFANLLNNAAKYTPPGGVISLSSRRDGDHVEITVRDTGVGIDEQLLPHVFSIFHQGRPSPSGSQGGLGIGLTLVKRLTEMHGGSVAARSAGAGQGSAFVVRLPLSGAMLRRETASEGATSALEPAGGPRRRVLVVDDNRDAADSLALLLEQLGHATRTAYDAEAALAAAAGFAPEVVLLDIELPDMSGYDLARRLRERLPAGAAIVAVTGWGQEADRQRSREAGFDAHLVKPVVVEHLAAIIRGEQRPPES